MHPLLKRQLRRFFGDRPPSSPELDGFVRAVGEAYAEFDDDRTMLEHSLALASKELEERYHALKADMAEREKMRTERDAFFRASPDMLSVINADMKLLIANPSWTRVLGYDGAALEGLDFLKTVHPDDVPRVMASAQQLLAQATAGEAHAMVRDFEFRQRTAEGEWRIISSAATVDPKRLVFFAVGRDVTAQRAMAKELEQTHRLEAVGQLASGMAHEINTPIQYVGDNVAFAADGFTTILEYVETL